MPEVAANDDRGGPVASGWSRRRPSSPPATPSRRSRPTRRPSTSRPTPPAGPARPSCPPAPRSRSGPDRGPRRPRGDGRRRRRAAGGPGGRARYRRRRAGTPRRTDGPESAAPVAEEVEMPAHAGSARPLGAANGRVFASPLARRLARDAGLAARRDHRHRAARPDPAPRRRGRGRRQRYPDGFGDGRRTDLRQTTGGRCGLPRRSRTRASGCATARRLTESKQQAPHFYLRATVRVEAPARAARRAQPGRSTCGSRSTTWWSRRSRPRTQPRAGDERDLDRRRRTPVRSSSTSRSPSPPTED